MSNIITLRPARPEDEPFMRALRGQMDAERLFMNYWQGDDAEELKKKILDLQFRGREAHDRGIKENWETKENVIELNGRPVGRFLVAGDGEQIHMSDLVVSKEFRGMGLGHMVIQNCMQECARSGRVLRLYVDKMNPAMNLYLSMNFYVVEDMPTHCMMEWNPKGPTGGRLYSFAQ